MRTSIISILVLATFFSTPILMSAQVLSGSGGSDPVLTGSGGQNPGVQLINPLQGGTLQSFLGNILNFVIRIGSVVVILMMVFVGFKFVTAQGNETKISEAKNMLLWTVIGALILLGAKAIAIGICETTNALSNSGSVVSCIFQMTFAQYIGSGSTGVVGLLNTVVVPVIFALAFLVFVWGVVNYFFFNSADEAKRAEGRSFILWGLLGMVLLFSVWGFVRLLLSTLGIAPPAA